MNKVRIFNVLGGVFVGMYILGVLCRIMHWPLGFALTFTGGLGAAISYILHYSLKPNQSFSDRMAIALIPLFFAALVLRKIDSNYQIVYISLAVAVTCAFLIYWTLKFTKSGAKINLQELNWERVFYVIGAIFVLIGVILKYQRMPQARLFLIGGLSIIAVSYFVGLFSKKGLED